MAKDNKSSQIVRNKKAFHDFEVMEGLECGIVLQGTEVKSLREGKVNFAQTYAYVNKKGELILQGLHIAPYAMGNRMNHEPERPRKLLAHKREIRRLAQKVEQQGLTLVPLKLYWKQGKCKVDLGLVRGKARFDKRSSLREKDMNRQIERQIRDR